MEWRRLRIEELDDLYSSPNSIRVIISRITRWAGHVARMEDLGLDERIILKCIFSVRSGSGWVQVAGDCKCGNGN